MKISPRGKHALDRNLDDEFGGPRPEKPRGGRLPKDAGLWAFVAAMVLYHAANAPGGVYLGLYLKRDLHAPERMLAYAFAVSMVAWLLVEL